MLGGLRNIKGLYFTPTRPLQILKEMNSGIDIYINDKFDVRLTEHGGRSCFARESMHKGTELLALDDWTGSSICYEFRKEVCHFCLFYAYGTVMKVKITSNDIEDMAYCNWKVTKYSGSGLWFCSDDCKRKYLARPNIGELLRIYENIVVNFRRMQKRAQNQIEEVHMDENISINDIEEEWREIEKVWIKKIIKMNSNKAVNRLPVIDEEHYSCIRFVIETLFNISHLEKENTKNIAFSSLQSNELDKLGHFPALLDFQVRVFQWVFLLAPELRSILTISLFRHILGSEYGNSFGIWQISEESEGREYLGYMVHPEASYFNHSCSPNVLKRREGRVMRYVLARDVSCGQQLCIDYKDILHLCVAERRTTLKENWFFDCKCDRCELEM